MNRTEKNERILLALCAAAAAAAAAAVALSPGGVISETACIVLSALSFAALVFGALLLRWGGGRASVFFGMVCTAVFTLLCRSWELIAQDNPALTVVRLIPTLTALGALLAMLLRRRGKTKAALCLQLAGPAVFASMLFVFALGGVMPHALMMPLGIAAGVIAAAMPAGQERAARTALDRVSMVTNALLAPVYFLLSAVVIVLSSLISGADGASLAAQALALVFALLAACAPVCCAVSLGWSAALRKRGRSAAGFAVQFLGFAGIGLSLLIIWLADVLPFLSASIN